MHVKSPVFRFLFILPVFSLTVFMYGCMSSKQDYGTMHIIKEEHSIQIDNGRIKLELRLDSVISQTYFTQSESGWKQVASAFTANEKTGSPVMPLYETGPGVANQYRLMTNKGLNAAQVLENNSDKIRLLLSGNINSSPVEETIELNRDQDYFHIEVSANLLKDPKLEYLLSAFTFNLPGEPDYSFVPALKRADDDVIGDRKFFAPAAILEKDGFMLALVPDLNLINDNIVYAKGARPQKHPRIFAVPFDTGKVSLPIALDMDLHSGVTKYPLIAYGFIDYWVEQHVYWRHDNNSGAQVRDLSTGKLHYGFDLFIDKEVTKRRGYQRLSTFLWQKYGSRYLQTPRPQAMPFSDYAKVCYPASFSYEGYDVVKGPGISNRHGHPELDTWQQWDNNGVAMGGLRLSAPQWYQFIYNTSWWNNVCDATGIYYWGKNKKDSSLIDKARRIINFTLSAPQQLGIFPSLYDINKKSWIASLWKPPLENYHPDSTDRYFNWENGDYQTSSASTTAAFLLQYRKECENDPGIIPYVQRYGDFIVNNLQPNGCLPAWFDKELRPLPSLKWNAEGGVHIWVLSELYAVTKDKKYLEAAQKMAKFMTDEVLPKQKWYDFETFYSCSVKPESFFDKRTGQFPANTMSVFWAMEGFASLYEISNQRKYLETAEAIADYSIFYQAVWAPHYIITAYPYGGFSSQNSDDEWLDQRGHLGAEALVRIGLLSARQDLLERGVAAARASLTLVNLPEHIKNDIYKYPNYPLGLGPENIDHEGFPQMPLRSGPTWCEVGGLTSAAYLLDHLGGAYINFKDSTAVGVDGVTVTSHSIKNDTITLGIKSLLSGLKFPYQESHTIHVSMVGLEKKKYTLILNDNQPIQLDWGQLQNLQITIYPDGRMKII